MKCLFPRQNLVLAFSAAVLLAACGGGGKAKFDIKGEVVGVQYAGLVLTNVTNGDTLSVPVGATTFKFAKQMEYGDVYDVQILNNANPLHQNCQVFNGRETAGRLATVNIGVQCALNQRTLGGKISGLTSDGLVLTNGSDEQLGIAKGNTAFVFGQTLPFGAAYGVTILKQPTANLCTLTNGVGTMGDVAIDTIAISCL